MFNSHYLAENIKKYRKAKRFTQSGLAAMLNVSPQSISKWECGITVPDVENICLLSQLLGVTVDNLLDHCYESRKIMIGVDGGGTKTQFLLFSEDGAVLDSIKLGGCNPNTVGIDGCIDVLSRGIDRLMQTNPNVCGIYIGAAGFLLGNNLSQIQNFLRKSYPHVKIGCSSDMLNISASALEDDTYCISVICGTGSSVLVKQNDTLTRLSGYGYLLSKSGSGYDIGRDGLYAVMCNMDGVGKDTLLTSLVKEKFGSTPSDIIDKVYKNDAAFTASAAIYVLEAFRKGDSVASDIVDANARALAEVINLAAQQNKNITDVVLSGGIITQNPDFALLVKKYISQSLNVTVPDTDPIIGACIQCARMCKTETKNLLKLLKESYSKER